MDLPTLGTNPKQSQSESETKEAKDLVTLRKHRRTVREAGVGRFASTGLMVCDPLADSLKNATAPPEVHLI
jgi:hypothetical protein